MRDVILLLISILPVILIGVYIYKKDHHKESIRIIAKLFLGGVASVLIVLIISYVLYMLFPSLTLDAIVRSNIIEKFFKIFVGVAIIEEGCKWLITYLLSYNSKYFDEYFDIVLYSVFVALGFACFENITYVFRNGLSTGFIRLFTAVPAHCFFGILMGEYLGLAKISELNGNIKLKRKNILLSIFLPSILHCVYNYFALSGGKYSNLFFVATVIFGYLISIDKITRISELSKNNYNVNYCSNCGNVVDGNFCSFCGKKNS